MATKKAAATEDKKATAPKPAASKDAKDIAKKASAGKSKVNTNLYKLSADAAKVKTPEELRLHEGSARYKCMAMALGAAKKFPKGIPFAEFEKVAGDQAAQAVKVLGVVGHLAVA